MSFCGFTVCCLDFKISKCSSQWRSIYSSPWTQLILQLMYVVVLLQIYFQSVDWLYNSYPMTTLYITILISLEKVWSWFTPVVWACSSVLVAKAADLSLKLPYALHSKLLSQKWKQTKLGLARPPFFIYFGLEPSASRVLCEQFHWAEFLAQTFW